ncbi:17650_t:CDS:2, partial [Acaulospora morrowiae]
MENEYISISHPPSGPTTRVNKPTAGLRNQPTRNFERKSNFGSAYLTHHVTRGQYYGWIRSKGSVVVINLHYGPIAYPKLVILYLCHRLRGLNSLLKLEKHSKSK